MSTPIRKRPSINEVANAIEEIGRVNEPPTSAPLAPTPVASDSEPYWRKTTIPFRDKQLTAMEDIVKRWQLDLRVKVSISEMMRFALDQLLADIEKDPDQVLLAIHRMYEKEMERTPTRKFGRTSGLEKHLKRKRLL